MQLSVFVDRVQGTTNRIKNKVKIHLFHINIQINAISGSVANFYRPDKKKPI
jgi:hypothetical protein